MGNEDLHSELDDEYILSRLRIGRRSFADLKRRHSSKRLGDSLECLFCDRLISSSRFSGDYRLNYII